VFDQPNATNTNNKLIFEKDRSFVNEMKRVIALSTVLGISALGMACGAPANNATPTPKPAATATATPVAVNTASPVNGNVNTNTNMRTGTNVNTKMNTNKK